MKKLSLRLVLLASVACLLLVSGGCAGRTSLKTQDVQDPGTLTGYYRLILYHEDSFDGLKTIAFLETEGSGYSLVPYADSYEYTVLSHVSGQEALGRALAFIRINRIYMSYEVSRILGPEGKTIGYEVRPLYEPLSFGLSDLMTVSYSLKEGGTVQIDIELIQKVIKQLLVQD